MNINTRMNTCCDTMGELTISDGTTSLTIDYDRESDSVELFGAIVDMFNGDIDKIREFIAGQLSGC